MPLMMCTKQLVRAMGKVGLAGLSPACAAESGSVLGNWGGKLFTYNRKRLVILGSEETLLTVLVPLAPSESLFDRFRFELAQELLRLGVDSRTVGNEVRLHKHLVLAANTNRSLIGSLNDLASLCSFHLDRYAIVSEDVLREIQRQLNHTPHCKRKHVFADQYLRALYGVAGLVS